MKISVFVMTALALACGVAQAQEIQGRPQQRRKDSC